MSDIEVYPMNVAGGGLFPPGEYVVIKKEQWDTFAGHYHDIFDERDKAIDLGVAIAEGTKYHDSMVKFVRWVFSMLKEILKASDQNVRMDMPLPKVFLDKMYELKLADQTYASLCEEDFVYEYTPVDSQWQIHLPTDLLEEHEHGDRAEESGVRAQGDGPEEGTP